MAAPSLTPWAIAALACFRLRRLHPKLASNYSVNWNRKMSTGLHPDDSSPSLLALVMLPFQFEITAEDIAVACALVGLIVVGIWVRWRR